MILANALAAPTELAAFEDHQWHSDNLATMTVPVYPLVGSTSPPFNRRFADFVARHVPGTRVQIVDGGNHATPTDNPKTFAAVLTDLRQREPNSDQAKE
jgi:pimeloyl-ACP methyl ester carboxylesterase